MTSSDQPNPSEIHSRAATCANRNIAVVAGPGSGKTTTLVNRIAHLVKTGVQQRHIACITFTNAAAREIEKRLASLDEEHAVKLGYCGTIHGFLLDLIHHHHGLLGMNNPPAVLSEKEARALAEECVAELRVKCTKKDIKAALEEGPARFLREDCVLMTHADRVARLYFSKCWHQGMLDFDTILSAGVMLLQRMGMQNSQLYEHVLWDEFQDSGKWDFEILKLLSNSVRFVVGDSDQSIYQFRGANPRQFLQFADNVSAVDGLFTLEANFRCSPAICDAANALIRHNTNRIAKQTISVDWSVVGEVSFRTYMRDGDEIAAIAADILQQPDITQCAVLLRTNALLTKYRLLLRGAGVATLNSDPTYVPDCFEMVMAWLGVVENPTNDYLAYRYLVLKEGKREADAKRLFAAQQLVSISQHGFHLPVFDRGSILANAAKAGADEEMMDILNTAVMSLREDYTLPELIAETSHLTAGTVTDEHMIHTSTYHGAKGLEFDNVYLPAFEQGIIPSGSKNADIEEERRLAFVGITRARRRVWISHCTTRAPQYGRGRPEPAFPSQFIGEIQAQGKA